MVWVERDLIDHLVLTPLPRVGSPATRPGCSEPLVLFLKSSLPLGSPSPRRRYSYICQQSLLWALSLCVSPPSPVTMHHKGIPGEAQEAANLPRSLKHLLVFTTKWKRPVMNLNTDARKSPGRLCCGKIQRCPSSSLLCIGRTQ